MPTGIEGDDRSLEALLVMDDGSGLIVQSRLMFAGELGEAADSLVETFRTGGATRRKGLPRKIVFSTRQLHDALAPALGAAGVTCIYMPRILKLQEAFDELCEFLSREVPPFEEAPSPHGAGDDAVPAADDLAGWKAADRRVCARLAACARSEPRLSSARAVKRYFGRSDLAGYFKAHQAQGVIAAYATWAVMDYRSNYKSRTRAEAMLEEGIPEAEAMLLEARMESYPTLYRVAGFDPKAGTVDLEDVLVGGAVTVNDQLLSENIKKDVFLTARAYAAGRFRFLDPMGPPLGSPMALEAVEFLEDCGLEFTPEGLQDGAHVFGWLWDWADEWAADRPPPHIVNTDGDDMLFHTASFSVADPGKVRQALLRRRDVEHYDQGDEFIWVKRTGRGAKMLGGPVTLGRIEFIGDELVLTANSSERFARARRWLEEVPGVVFRSVTTRSLDEVEKDRPMDERIARPEPVEITPEIAAGIQEMLGKKYMDWLDEPLPILGGKTPRQACKTPAGRRQVTTLIRTMPDPMGPAPVRVPRQAMLRALGLAADEAPLPAGGLPVPAIPALADSVEADDWADDPIVNRSPKIGRNDPCPCGSGKKFKKCCGR